MNNIFLAPRVVYQYANLQEETTMKEYECDLCGYVYDPTLGDPDNGVKPGTAFEDIPEDWVCPLCGAPKSDFSVRD